MTLYFVCDIDKTSRNTMVVSKNSETFAFFS